MNKKLKKLILMPMNLLYKINPSLELKILYRLKTGRKLNLENPVTYNEKLQWIKLNYKNEWLPKCADKYSVREFVKQRGCEHLLIKLLWEGFDPRDIPFENLPQKFVLKATHGSGFNILCKDKNKLDIPKTIKTLKHWLKEKYIPCYGEWFYGVIKPRIIIEEYLEDKYGDSLIDYKISCFEGIPQYINVHVNRFTNHRNNFYDLEWNPIDITMKDTDKSLMIEKPKELEQLLDYAKILSDKFIHVRVDFYITKSGIYFGELTFASDSGFFTISPIEMDVKIGSYMKLRRK